MLTLRVNLAANLAGKIALSLLAFLFVPYYLDILGAEAYGLIGFFALLQATFLLADGGLSSAYTREVARISASSGVPQHLLDLTITLERLVFGIGVATMAAIIALSHLLALHWFQSTQLSVETKTNCVMLMGLIVGLQLPFLVYQGGLSGLQMHLRLNVLLVVIALLRGVGAIAALALISKKAEVFFIWQAAVSVIQLFCARLLLLISISNPEGKKGTFQLKLVLRLWRFSIGIFGTTVSGIVLMQLDKVILSKTLPLDIFGYYTLAGMLATIPLMVGQPINASIYPRFTQLVANDDTTNLVRLYHRVSQAMSLAVIPLGLTIAAFPETIMYFWSGNLQAAQNSSLIVSLLSVGYTLMALMLAPYSLQLAYSWTKLGFYLNIATIIVLVPILLVLISRFGGTGAAMVFILVYSLQIIVMIHVMHTRLLKQEKWNWYINDVGKPCLIAMLVVAGGRFVTPSGLSTYGSLAAISIVWVATACATATSLPFARERMFFMYKLARK